METQGAPISTPTAFQIQPLKSHCVYEVFVVEKQKGGGS